MTMKHRIQQAVGSAREKAGEVTGNRRLKASGRAQRRTAQLRSRASDVGRRARRVAREAQVRLRGERPVDPR
ncbi:CsbD family protein [Amycolatopsis sp. DG1A-15b]|uniref:CsbD family protein n=1 Tax=Amycolatopsis sp. DG1A-15b TaxID=3052846 RepID=UPI00255B68BE|nr:CsbD family protein [Amycolatopsis sp. DG1A-15b]WIX86460.1 CsbD family protein [Amycolatopsis sp. DG1A-15b]